MSLKVIYEEVLTSRISQCDCLKKGSLKKAIKLKYDP